MRPKNASEEQHKNNQYDYTYPADGVKAPLLAVPPDWKTSYQRRNYHNGQNEDKHHALVACLTSLVRRISALARADPATRGSTISFFTLNRTDW